jgi:hypothetical protein
METALRKDKPLIPVLVLRASMPRPEQLPDSLQDFAYRNAVSIDAERDFDHHMTGLIRAMDRNLTRETARNGSEAFATAETHAETANTIDDQRRPAGSLVLTQQLEALREANRMLEMQLTEARAKQEEVSADAGQLRNELTAAHLRREEEVQALTEQLVAARDAAISRQQAVDEAERTLADREKRLKALTDELALVRASNGRSRTLSYYRTAIVVLVIAFGCVALALGIIAQRPPSEQLAQKEAQPAAQTATPPIPNLSTTASIVSLAKKYEAGIGIPRDYEKAATLYRKAADQGDGTALLNLGQLYREGLGVTRDPAQACKLFRQAAAAGNAEASYHLSNCS